MFYSIINFFQDFWLVFAVILFWGFLNLLFLFNDLEHSQEGSSDE